VCVCACRTRVGADGVSCVCVLTVRVVCPQIQRATLYIPDEPGTYFTDGPLYIRHIDAVRATAPGAPVCIYMIC